jgi:hypothetical protein
MMQRLTHYETLKSVIKPVLTSHTQIFSIKSLYTSSISSRTEQDESEGKLKEGAATLFGHYHKKQRPKVGIIDSGFCDCRFMTDDGVWFEAFTVAVDNEALSGNQLCHQYGVSVWRFRGSLCLHHQGLVDDDGEGGGQSLKHQSQTPYCDYLQRPRCRQTSWALK